MAIGLVLDNQGSLMEESGNLKESARSEIIEKFKVELPSTGGWADYIFNKDYKLLPIRQLESFIKQYHHLPNFPSEKSILKAGGYEMSDMIKRQQESIEQLHLYIIEIEHQLNKMKDLERRILGLEKKLQK